MQQSTEQTESEKERTGCALVEGQGVAAADVRGSQLQCSAAVRVRASSTTGTSCGKTTIMVRLLICDGCWAG